MWTISANYLSILAGRIRMEARIKRKYTRFQGSGKAR